MPKDRIVRVTRSKIRVLVFGSTGTGKTSLCNALTGSSRPTDSGALGVTEKSHLYAPFSDGELSIELVDTVGLHESVHGTVPAEQAVQDLVELLNKSRAGFSLLIQVARASRITRDHDDDYAFFVEKMTQGKIPVVLAVTNCENEEPMSGWVERNRDHFARFAYREIVPTCFAVGGSLEEFYSQLRADSRARLVESIRLNATREPVLLFGPDTGVSFADALSRIWNDFVTIAGLPPHYRRKVNETAYGMIRRIGVPKKVADAMIKHIPDLIGEIGSKAPIPGIGSLLKYLSRKALQRIFRRAP